MLRSAILFDCGPTELGSQSSLYPKASIEVARNKMCRLARPETHLRDKQRNNKLMSICRERGSFHARFHKPLLDVEHKNASIWDTKLLCHKLLEVLFQFIFRFQFAARVMFYSVIFLAEPTHISVLARATEKLELFWKIVPFEINRELKKWCLRIFQMSLLNVFLTSIRFICLAKEWDICQLAVRTQLNESAYQFSGTSVEVCFCPVEKMLRLGHWNALWVISRLYRGCGSNDKLTESKNNKTNRTGQNKK